METRETRLNDAVLRLLPWVAKGLAAGAYAGAAVPCEPQHAMEAAHAALDGPPMTAGQYATRLAVTREALTWIVNRAAACVTGHQAAMTSCHARALEALLATDEVSHG